MGAAPPASEDVRRRRLRYRSWHRGMRETDLLLGRFADRHLADMTPAQLADYEALLTCPDPDIYDWVCRDVPVPAAHDTPVMRMLRAFALAR